VGIREHLASADDHPLLLGWDGFQKELTNLLGVCSKPFETVTFFFPCSPPPPPPPPLWPAIVDYSYNYTIV